jgi:hypothetical protein
MAQIPTDTWTPVPQRMAVMQDLGDDWRAAYQVDVSDGRPRITEIRVYAAPQPRPQSRPTDPVRRKRPDRALSKTTLAQLDPNRAIEALQEGMETDATLTTLIRDAIAAEPDRPGRRGRGDWWWAAIALIYLNLLWEGSESPAADTSEIIGEHYGEHYVRDALRSARRKGLLTNPGQGRTDGQLLTANGIQALVDRDEYGELAGAIHDGLVVGWPAEWPSVSIRATRKHP